jgi:hypothetical protein
MPSITKPTGRESDKFMLRLPDGMRDEIARSAQEKNRTMNAEIVTRLRESLAGSGALPVAIRDDVESLAKAQGCSVQDALVQLVTLGMTHGGTVLFVRIGPGTTLAQMLDMLGHAEKLVPRDASLIVDRQAE